MHVLVYYTILTLNYSSYKKCHTHSRSSLMCVFVRNISYKYLKRFLAASSTLDCKKAHRIPILTKKKLDKISAGLKTSPTKSQGEFAHYMICVCIICTDMTELMYLQSLWLNSFGLWSLRYRSWNENDFVNWHLHGVHDGEIDLTLILFGGKVWLLLRGCVNSQNKRYWSAGSCC